MVMTAALGLVLLSPWQRSVRAPAVLGQAQAHVVYAPRAAQVAALPVHEGQQVQAGAVLAQLASPDLDYQLASARQQAAQLQWQLEQQPFDDDLRALGPALRKRRDAARQTVAGYEAEQARLTLRAPFAGRVVDVNPTLRPDEWLKAGEALLGVVGGGGVKGDAFVDEAALARLASGQPVRFRAGVAEFSTVHCRLGTIDRLNLAVLDEPYVASIYGGQIASVRRPDGSLAPLESTFRVRFDGCDRDSALPREIPGTAVIEGESRSLLGRFARWLGALLRRDISF
jgi:putative peptide zinc metalloprotease protein